MWCGLHKLSSFFWQKVIIDDRIIIRLINENVQLRVRTFVYPPSEYWKFTKNILLYFINWFWHVDSHLISVYMMVSSSLVHSQSSEKSQVNQNHFVIHLHADDFIIENGSSYFGDLTCSGFLSTLQASDCHWNPCSEKIFRSTLHCHNSSHNAQPRPQLLFPFKPVINRFSLDFGCKIESKQLLRIV